MIPYLHFYPMYAVFLGFRSEWSKSRSRASMASFSNAGVSPPSYLVGSNINCCGDRHYINTQKEGSKMEKSCMSNVVVHAQTSALKWKK